MIFRTRAIRYIFCVSLIIGLACPLLYIYYITPSFTHLLISVTEHEAVIVGKHLADMYIRRDKPLSKEGIGDIAEQIDRHVKEFKLTKLKIFSPSGVVLYSSDRKDIGTINRMKYFHDIVAAGSTFVKTLEKGSASLDGQKVSADVVETYVPIMNKDRFMGAFEIYYDITVRNQLLNKLVFKSAVIPFAFMVGFLTIIILLLIKLDGSIQAQKKTNETLNIYARKLRSSNEELNGFLHAAAHDLQEPLRKIRALGDIVKSRYAGIGDEGGRNYIDRMQDATTRMQTLIYDLRIFSSLTSRALPFESVDLDRITQDVIAGLENRIEETHGSVETNSLPVIDADPQQMRQLIENLLSNALKFHRADEAPAVKIHGELIQLDNDSKELSEKHDTLFRLTVEDNGIGFDEKNTGRIFGVFQRLHGRSEYDGSGIGLSVCKKIVERHGGCITATSRPGRGAKFMVTLPARQDSEDAGRQ